MQAHLVMGLSLCFGAIATYPYPLRCALLLFLGGHPGVLYVQQAIDVRLFLWHSVHAAAMQLSTLHLKYVIPYSSISSLDSDRFNRRDATARSICLWRLRPRIASMRAFFHLTRADC